MSDDTSKTATWLGIAVSILTVLAFFGVKNFDELKQAIDSDSGDRKACNQVAEYTQQNKINVQSPAQIKIYADVLRDAATKASSADFRSKLHNAAEYWDAQARQLEDPSYDAPNDNSATALLTNYCAQLST
ncbi:hypothetical protein [Streptomyces cacaoi]|uniref:Dicer dsRNA-binding fold domain-containing protein n=1 Tax=Streptomyces cacaoi TaxID=1898 RepID=A0A4Y3QZH9_STRCI|nr:hypothetical protein [Streptomyces cacaoi]NNG87594.1 hypothetical protein [Streptomyces cacaoi]GEB50389.1 hypothetical protein SCA03_29400 [Streptomyces cacaoi]